MVANKFATMLHENTNRITLILVYVLLEWVMIVLLLLNSLFSYLIVKFADYFGLKRPCLWCSRLDHVFEPSKYKNSYRDLVCDDHANEISKLGFCSNHRRLSESRDMCGDCLSSSSPEVMENGDENFKCSCCGNLIAESGEKVDKDNASDGIRSGVVADDREDEQRIEENKGVGIISDGDEERGVEKDEFSCFISSFDCNQVTANGNCAVIEKDQESVEGDFILSMKDESPEILAKHLEFYIEGDDCHLIPVELMDSDAEGSQKIYKLREENQCVSDNGDVIFDFDSLRPAPVKLAMENNCSPAEEVTPLSTHETETENETSTAVLAVVESMESNEEEEDDDVQTNAATREGEINVDTNQVHQFAAISSANQPNEDIQMQNFDECTQEDHGSNDAEDEITLFKAATAETSDQAMKNHFSLSSDLYEIEEDKVPDTPTSIESFHQLHKKLLLLDRRDSGTEDPMDGNIFSDIEGADGVLTVEKLKSALKTERKALNALYMELEEERSASAVAASQTMAMITRIQEEKAAMQMEALQYQRMMEEQSEYDQEALQLLNELMVKREKEKVELEKELEIYRRKVLDYEAKERMMMPIRRKDYSSRSASSASCSNAEDSDGVSVDLNHESKGEDRFENHQVREDVNPNTPANAVLYLEESLACFEEKRVSILEQLMFLEEKLASLNDEEAEQHFEYFYGENGNVFHESSHFGHETNGVANGHFKGVNGKHHEDKLIPMAAKAKRLLPHFNATDADIEDTISNGHENGFRSVSHQHSSLELESKTIAIKEEVDRVYERLQALEADREFVKHCTSSLNKGDKGIYLLQEILQHLRDLRSVELRSCSTTEKRPTPAPIGGDNTVPYLQQSKVCHFPIAFPGCKALFVIFLGEGE
ncbi:Cysteine-rich receptor-like protein kinase 10 [Hibiscus syriacus]|uniref:Cysteine-rich receptor-like protein kinase 10 n=1 Tax=Hibiscus syriacus TaxID=106335 RepID=A0A6A3B003_HIBSY|nr:Cysteine-rich receptor-like protein kinase 10 [Hibiscus syriacus]